MFLSGISTRVWSSTVKHIFLFEYGRKIFLLGSSTVEYMFFVERGLNIYLGRARSKPILLGSGMVECKFFVEHDLNISFLGRARWSNVFFWSSTLEQCFFFGRARSKHILFGSSTVEYIFFVEHDLNISFLDRARSKHTIFWSRRSKRTKLSSLLTSYLRSKLSM